VFKLEETPEQHPILYTPLDPDRRDRPQRRQETTMKLDLTPAEQSAIRNLGGPAYVGLFSAPGRRKNRTSIYRTAEAAEQELDKVVGSLAVGVMRVDPRGNCTPVDADRQTAGGLPAYPLVRVGLSGRVLHAQHTDGRAVCEAVASTSGANRRQGANGGSADPTKVSEAFPTGLTGRPTCERCLEEVEKRESGAAPRDGAI
jgi:hypothetical protein